MDRLDDLKKRFAEEPLARKFQMWLDILDEGHAVVRYVCHDEDCVTNNKGERILQGGVAGGVLADFAAAYAAMSVIPEGHTPNTDGNYSLYRPIFAGEEVLAVAQVFNKSKSRISVEVKVTSLDEKLKCKGVYHFDKPR